MTDPTAQSGDILTWLYGAIRVHEDTARAAAALQDDPENGWGIVDDSSYAVPGKQRAIAPHIGITHEPESAQHIVLNNPAAVLRRCAADRKLLELHAGQGHSCPSYDYDGDLDSFARFYNHEVCPVVQTLAEGYGWAEG
ncbi:DUF6221 family protein (plasmid) [Streptomyces sp. GDS52]|uniref:DUF6221 family protein n=1 Tax=Streptomyces sp. GDS52 TaxID=3406419 RepID=UPI003FCFD6C1